MAKRTAAAVSPRSKRAKAAADPLTAKLETVAAALESAHLPAPSFQMFSSMMPHTLGIVREERHRFQEEAVALIESELKKKEDSLDQAIKSAHASKEVMAMQLTTLQADLTKLQETVQQKKEELQKRKVALAEDARAFQKSKATRQERLDQQDIGLADMTKAEASRTKLDGFVQQINEVHKEDAKGIDKFLKDLCKLVDIDDSMKTAIPSALSKATEARGGFDVMVVQQLNERITKCMDELKAKIANQEPMKAALETDVKEAEATHQTNKKAQMTSAKAFAEMQELVEAEEAKAKQTHKEITAAKRHDKKAAEAVAEAEKHLGDFRQGPLEAFSFLKERSAEKADEAMPEQPAD
eukprot:TRINITY_DN1007_c0_g1_i1.p1 TRINITY_DN1007_c0_g1~~TRINITY_DN1007_c0_g1_i1.p1  ORF type:complete len:354 (+),score=174.07 TRINITY_DN1007_c0_g1_i1:113-1174(+)